MDKSTAEAYVEDLLEERDRLYAEIRELKEKVMNLSIAYVDKVMDNNHHIIDKVHE